MPPLWHVCRILCSQTRHDICQKHSGTTVFVYLITFIDFFGYTKFKLHIKKCMKLCSKRSVDFALFSEKVTTTGRIFCDWMSQRSRQISPLDLCGLQTYSGLMQLITHYAKQGKRGGNVHLYRMNINFKVDHLSYTSERWFLPKKIAHLSLP